MSSINKGLGIHTYQDIYIYIHTQKKENAYMGRGNIGVPYQSSCQGILSFGLVNATCYCIHQVSHVAVAACV